MSLRARAAAAPTCVERSSAGAHSAVHARRTSRSGAPGRRAPAFSPGSPARKARDSASSIAGGMPSPTRREWRRSPTFWRSPAQAGQCSSSRSAPSWPRLARAQIVSPTPTMPISFARVELRMNSSARFVAYAEAASSRSCPRACRKSRSSGSGIRRSPCGSWRRNVDLRQQRQPRTGDCGGCRKSRVPNFRRVLLYSRRFRHTHKRRVCARPASDSDPVRRHGPERGSTGGGGRPRSFPSGPPLRAAQRRAGRAEDGRAGEAGTAFKVDIARECRRGPPPSRSAVPGRSGGRRPRRPSRHGPFKVDIARECRRGPPPSRSAVPGRSGGRRPRRRSRHGL